MRIFLAPMEGVVDHHMRALLSQLGGVDLCVTEFVRVTDAVLPERVFKPAVPGNWQTNAVPLPAPPCVFSCWAAIWKNWHAMAPKLPVWVPALST